MRRKARWPCGDFRHAQSRFCAHGSGQEYQGRGAQTMSPTHSTRTRPLGRAWPQTFNFVDRFSESLIFSQSQLFGLHEPRVGFHVGLPHSLTPGNFKNAGQSAHLDVPASAFESPRKLVPAKSHRLPAKVSARCSSNPRRWTPRADSTRRHPSEWMFFISSTTGSFSSSTGSIKTLVFTNVWIPAQRAGSCIFPAPKT